MEGIDYRPYLCSNCYRRCLWTDLSPQEHRCFYCRLPLKNCAICSRIFEPIYRTDLYCKYCDFHIACRTPSTPSDMELDEIELESWEGGYVMN